MKQTRRIYGHPENLPSDGYSHCLIDQIKDCINDGYSFYDIVNDVDGLQIRPYKLHKETDAEEEAREKREAGLE